VSTPFHQFRGDGAGATTFFPSWHPVLAAPGLPWRRTRAATATLNVTLKF